MPFATPLAELDGFWLIAECDHDHVSNLAICSLAAEHGPHATLGKVLSRIRCRACGSCPHDLILVRDPARRDRDRLSLRLRG